MSHRRAADRYPSTERGDVYVLHLDPPYRHASHYTGFAAYKNSNPETPNLRGRLDAHANGTSGARLMEVQHQADGSFRLGRLFQDVNRERESIIKQSSGAQYCLICRGQPEVKIPDEPARYVRPELTPADVGVTEDQTAWWVQNEPDMPTPDPAAEPGPRLPSLPEWFWAAELDEPEIG